MQTIIFGNGSMARVLYSYMKDSFDIAGFCVDSCCLKDAENTYCDLPLVSFEDVQEKFPPSEFNMILSIGFIEMNGLRECKYLEAKAKGYKFVSYIDPSVKIHNGVEIGENSIVLDFVSIHPDSKIGHSTFISSNVNIGHDCIVGDLNWINSGVSIAGGVNVGKKCFFGVNSCVSHGVRMGEQTFTSANTLISKDTNAQDVYIPQNPELFRLKSKKFLKFIGG